MAFQAEHRHQITAEEALQIDEYNKIIEFHNLIVSGKHPKIKLTPEQVSGVPVELTRELGIAFIVVSFKLNYLPQLVSYGCSPASIEPVTLHDLSTPASAAKIHPQIAQPHQSLVNAKMSGQASKNQPGSFEMHEPLGDHFDNAPPSAAKSPRLSTNTETSVQIRENQSSSPKASEPFGNLSTGTKSSTNKAPTLIDAPRVLHPSQNFIPPLPSLRVKAPPSSSNKSDTSRLDYCRDYYHDLGLSSIASKIEIRDAFRAIEVVNPNQQDAYEILTDDYLRHIYDDARTFASNVAKTSSSDVRPVIRYPEPEEEQEEGPKINAAKDYYKALGVQPGVTVTTDSITRAFNHKISVHGPKSAKFRSSGGKGLLDEHRCRLDEAREAYAVLSNYKLRLEYDRARGIPLHSRAGDSLGEIRAGGCCRR